MLPWNMVRQRSINTPMSSDFPKLRSTIEGGIAIGQHIGAVVHVRQHGKVVADFAIGAADIDPYASLRTDQRLLWLSAGKPLTAIAAAILHDRGRIDFSAPVTEYLPDFGRHGKELITVRHLMTHTHAYKPPRLDWPRLPRQTVIEQICDAHMIDGQAPGEYAAYDPQSTWYLLSEIVAVTSGRPNHEFVKEEFLAPLGCESASIGLEAGDWTAAVNAGHVAVLHDTTSSARERVDLIAAASGQSITGDPATDHVHHPSRWVGDDAQRAAAHNPGGGSLGRAADLAAVYHCLLDGGKTPDGHALLRSQTVEDITRRQRIGLVDQSFGQVIDWGLGFLVNSFHYGHPAVPYSYGRHASEDTFGHGGMQSSCGFADPVHNLAAAIILNGLPGEPKHQKRILDINTALYEDLGLVH